MDRTQQYIDDLKSTLDGLNRGQLNAMIELFFYAQREQKQIFTFGNGGSGATASHAAGDFIKGASFGLEKRFRMICLNDNIPSMMAIANDTSWSEIFVEALKNYLNPGDVVIGISGSGNSENVIKALQFANDHQAKTIAMCGFKGGKIAEMAEVVIHAQIHDMEVVEDVHMAVFNIVKKHMMAELHSNQSMGSTYDARIQ
ncbi:MAG: SIS domain-containing protein [Flavobacteriales bacterium]|jgi:D-sedoheptulose 7-phosphate isomerase